MNTAHNIDRSASTVRSRLAKDFRYGAVVGKLRPEQTDTQRPAEWRLSAFAGRFSEVSADPSGASLTLVFRLVLEMQKQREPVAWITHRQSTFFPPDAADAGVDLAALAVIRAGDPLAAAAAAEHLLRSGAFGLVVMDLGTDGRLPIHAQARLAGQARKHDTALLCLTEKESHRPSLGSLVSLRAHTARMRAEAGCFRCEARVVKDKHRGPGWIHVEVYHGPDGLC